MHSAEVQDDTYAVVKRAWIDTLPRAPFDPEQSWEDAGADSLKSLHLVMRLEKALGRKVPFDLISREMTVADLAERLDRDGAASGGAAPSGSNATVFFVPGLYGDDSTQADFRRAFEGSVALEVIDLPDLDTATEVLSDMAATGRVIAEEILRRAPHGDIFLAGYSFGGSVAFEAAHCLTERGRSPRFIAIIDTMLDPAADGFAAEEAALEGAVLPVVAQGEAEAGLARRLLPKPGERPLTYFDRVFFAALMRTGRLEAAKRTVLRTRDRVTPELLVNRRKFVLGSFRRRAFQNWRPQPSELAAFVVSSDDGARQNLLARWERLCPGARTLHVAGGHMDILKQPALGPLVRALEEAVAQAGVPGN